MSALPPKAEVRRTSRKSPLSAISGLREGHALARLARPYRPPEINQLRLNIRPRVEKNSAKDRHLPVAISHGGSTHKRWLCRVAAHSSCPQLGTRWTGKEYGRRSIRRYTAGNKNSGNCAIGSADSQLPQKKYGLFGGLTGHES